MDNRRLRSLVALPLRVLPLQVQPTRDVYSRAFWAVCLPARKKQQQGMNKFHMIHPHCATFCEFCPPCLSFRDPIS